MRIVVLGLSLSSAWGNGHATTWRALLRAFAARGHDVLFLERDVPWYAAHRDLPAPDFCTLSLYSSVGDLAHWQPVITEADAVIVGSYVPDGIAVGDLVLDWATGVTSFYDIDTPVTLVGLDNGTTDFISPAQIAQYDCYLSFTGGPTLDRLERQWGSPMARALYCSVDSQKYRPTGAARGWDLSYLGTYSPDRQPTLERLLIEPARMAPQRRFVVAGSRYPDTIEWPANVERIEHCPPGDHPDFYSASRYTLNVTRADMIAAGWSPSVRLFEAAACGTPILSDRWAGLDTLFQPGAEIALPDDAAAVVAMLERDGSAMGQAARARVLSAHTAVHRAAELDVALAEAAELKTRSARMAAMAGEVR